MKIFYIEIDKFKNMHEIDFLSAYADRKFKTDKRFFEYAIGRYIVKTVAQQYYNIDFPKIIINSNGKPLFKNSSVHFSISHSNNIVMVCFDKYNCGIDIEYIKNPNLNSLSKYFCKEFKTVEEFYKFWTLREASIKLGENIEYQYFQKFKDNYYFTVVSDTKKINNIQIFDFNS